MKIILGTNSMFVESEYRENQQVVLHVLKQEFSSVSTALSFCTYIYI